MERGSAEILVKDEDEERIEGKKGLREEVGPNENPTDRHGRLGHTTVGSQSFNTVQIPRFWPVTVSLALFRWITHARSMITGANHSLLCIKKLTTKS